MSKLAQSNNPNNQTTDQISDSEFKDDMNPNSIHDEQLQQMRVKYWAQTPNSQQSTQELRGDVETIGTKVRLLENIISMHDTRIEELEFRADSTPFENHLDEILNYVTKTFQELDFVTEIHYAPLENKVFELTVIHTMNDSVEALKSTNKKFLSIENTFFDVNFEMVLLHKDEIQPDHLMRTKPVFSKT